MTCQHGFIGACAVCDGAGQLPEPDEDSLRCVWCSGIDYHLEGCPSIDPPRELPGFPSAAVPPPPL